MASSTFTNATQASKEEIWSFLLDKEGWAPLIPGYLHHELQATDEMIWVFKGDFGIVEKAIKLHLKVKEVTDQECIAFDLVGLSDNINGEGFFSLDETDGENAITGSLTMKAGGFLASMINPILEKFVPQTIEAHVKAMTGKFV